MEGKNFRELVGGLIYENPNNVRDKGKSKVANLHIFKQIAKVKKNQSLLTLINIKFVFRN